MRNIVLRYSLICDDVRREDNGKLIFIGVYAAAVLVSKIPSKRGMSLVLCVDTEEKAALDIGFRVRLDSEVIRSGKGKLEIIEPTNNIFLVIPRIPLAIAREGILYFEINCPPSEEWELAIAVPVSLRPNLSTSAPPPSEQSQSAASS